MAHALIENKPGIGNACRCLAEESWSVKGVLHTGNYQSWGLNLSQALSKVELVFSQDGDHQV